MPYGDEAMRTTLAMLLVLATAVCRADTFAYVSLAKDGKVAVYKIEPASGALAHVGDAPCAGEPAALIASPNKTALYASLRPEGKLVAFRIDRQAGTLSHLNTVDAGIDPAHVSTDKEGRFLLT